MMTKHAPDERLDPIEELVKSPRGDWEYCGGDGDNGGSVHTRKAAAAGPCRQGVIG